MTKQTINPGSGDKDSREQKRKITGELHVRGEIEANIPSTAIQQYKAARQENTPRDNWRFLVECVTLFFVIVVAILGVIQTRQAIKSANAAKHSADAATSALNLTRAQVLPAIVPEYMDIKQPLVAGEPITISNSYKNVGGSIAIEVQSLATSRSVIDGSGPSWEFHEFTGSKASVGQGQTFDTAIVIGPQTATQILQFQNGSRKFYTSGLITYHDITGTTHHRYYCFTFDPKTGNGNGCKETKQSD